MAKTLESSCPFPIPLQASYHSLAHHCCPCSHQHHCTQPTSVHSGSSFYNWIPYDCHNDRRGPLKREKAAKSEWSLRPAGKRHQKHLSTVIFRKWCWWVTMTMSPIKLTLATWSVLGVIRLPRAEIFLRFFTISVPLICVWEEKGLGLK